MIFGTICEMVYSLVFTPDWPLHEFICYTPCNYVVVNTSSRVISREFAGAQAGVGGCGVGGCSGKGVAAGIHHAFLRVSTRNQYALRKPANTGPGSS